MIPNSIKSELDYFKALEMIHDDRRSHFVTFGTAAYEVSRKYKDSIHPFQHRYMIKVPVRKKNGEYLWVQQTSQAFEIDEDRNLISHINFCNIISEYKGQLIENPTVFASSELGRIPKWEDEVIKFSMKSITLPLSLIHI